MNGKQGTNTNTPYDSGNTRFILNMTLMHQITNMLMCYTLYFICISCLRFQFHFLQYLLCRHPFVICEILLFLVFCIKLAHA